MLAQAIERLADDPALRLKLGIDAGKFVANNFEEQVTGRKMFELYEKALK